MKENKSHKDRKNPTDAEVEEQAQDQEQVHHQNPSLFFLHPIFSFSSSFSTPQYQLKISTRLCAHVDCVSVRIM